MHVWHACELLYFCYNGVLKVFNAISMLRIITVSDPSLKAHFVSVDST